MLDSLPPEPVQIPSPRRWRSGLATALVLVSAALVFRVVDALPGWLYGLPRGVHACPNLAEAVARTGLDLRDVQRLQASAGWQPEKIRTMAHPPAVAVTFRDRADGQTASELLLYRSRGQHIPDALCSPLSAFHTITVPLGPQLTATLAAKVLPDGDVLHELSWSASAGGFDGDEHTVMRFAGRTVELLRLARLLVDRDR